METSSFQGTTGRPLRGVAGNCQNITCHGLYHMLLLSGWTARNWTARHHYSHKEETSTPSSPNRPRFLGDIDFPGLHTKSGQSVSVLRQETFWQCNQLPSQWTFSPPDFYWHLADSCHLQQFPSEAPHHCNVPLLPPAFQASLAECTHVFIPTGSVCILS